MSIAEQRSLIRGLSYSGLLPQLEKVTLGDGTTSYVRNPGRGPGRDLYAVSIFVGGGGSFALFQGEERASNPSGLRGK